MSIVIIKGQPKSGKSLIAAALRNNQISYKKGALLVDDFQKGEVKHQLEKILDNALPLPDGVGQAAGFDVKKLPWKPDSMVILVGGDGFLAEAEKLLPGFIALFQPTYTIETGKK
jgi:NAD kinase